MNFGNPFKPTYTVAMVANDLARGLRSGSVVLELDDDTVGFEIVGVGIYGRRSVVAMMVSATVAAATISVGVIEVLRVLLSSLWWWNYVIIAITTLSAVISVVALMAGSSVETRIQIRGKSAVLRRQQKLRIINERGSKKKTLRENSEIRQQESM